MVLRWRLDQFFHYCIKKKARCPTTSVFSTYYLVGHWSQLLVTALKKNRPKYFYPSSLYKYDAFFQLKNLGRSLVQKSIEKTNDGAGTLSQFILFL